MQRASVANTLAGDARLLLEAGRLRGAAILHAEACACLLGALLTQSDGDAAAGPAALSRSDALAPRFRAVWLERPAALAPVPNEADLRAMADGLRALVPAVLARIAPTPAPAPPERAPDTGRKVAVRHDTPAVVTRKPVSVPPCKEAPARTRASAPSPGRERTVPPPRPSPPPLPRPAAPPAPHRPVSSAAFWSLIDRWGVDDRDALAMLGHAGGLTRRGTRPRFRLVDAEIDRFHLMQTLDDALAALGTEPRTWLRTQLDGSAPLAAILHDGEAALRRLTREVMGEGLRRSLG